MGEPEATERWTCGHCNLEVRWASGYERQGLPANWIEDRSGPVCLACRRELAAEAAIDQGGPLSVQDRARLRSAAIIEFEVNRDPSRSDSEIAKAVHTSVVAIQKARKRLGVHAAGGVETGVPTR